MERFLQILDESPEPVISEEDFYRPVQHYDVCLVRPGKPAVDVPAVAILREFSECMFDEFFARLSHYKKAMHTQRNHDVRRTRISHKIVAERLRAAEKREPTS